MADLLFIFIIVYVLHVKHWGNGCNVPSISTKDYIMVIKIIACLIVYFFIDHESKCVYRICAWIQTHVQYVCIYMICQGSAQIIMCAPHYVHLFVFVCVSVCTCVSFLWHRADTHSASFPVEASPWCPLTQYLWGWLAEELNTPS